MMYTCNTCRLCIDIATSVRNSIERGYKVFKEVISGGT